LIFDGDLAAPTANLNSLSDITGDTTTHSNYFPGIRVSGTGHFKTSYAKVGGKYDAQYTSDGILGDTVDFNSEGFYPYRTQSNLVYHEHLKATGTTVPWPSAGSIDLQIYGAGGSTVELGNINATPPTSPKFRYADSDRNQNYSSTPGTGLSWNPVESAVVNGARIIAQYNYKRISSTGIRHPEGIVPPDQGSGDNKNSYRWQSSVINDPLIDETAIYNQTAYIGGAMNTKDGSAIAGGGTSIASYDSAKVHAPKYRYWVLRIPVSIPEYTS
jgi:hypothetical protein